MKKISRLLLLLLFPVLLLNCASFSNKDFKNDYTKINDSELNSFNGKYSFFPIKKFDKKNANSDFDLSKNVINSYNYSTNEILKFDDRDSILNGQNTYYIQLNILTNTELSVELFKNNNSIKKQQIKM